MNIAQSKEASKGSSKTADVNNSSKFNSADDSKAVINSFHSTQGAKDADVFIKEADVFTMKEYTLKLGPIENSIYSKLQHN